METRQKTFLTILAVVAWFALIAQLYLAVINRLGTIPAALVQYISYFTILTNILVAVFATLQVLGASNKMTAFFSKASTLTAITMYIGVVGITYNVVLRNIWNPQGLQRVVDELLHVGVPVLTIAYWYFFVAGKRLKWQSILNWLLFPLAYTIYVLLRGEVIHQYPYPFMDVVKFGYATVLRNSLVVLAVFVLVAVVLVAISNAKAKKISP